MLKSFTASTLKRST